jgi:hypothetical protein
MKSSSSGTQIIKISPLYPPSPLLLILSKGTRFEILLVEILQIYVSILTAVSPPIAKLTANGGDIREWWRFRK